MLPLALRAPKPADEAFLWALYCAVRAPEFAMFPEPVRDNILRMQYHAQSVSYAAAYPGSGYEIITRDDCAVGRVWIARTENEMRLVDIAVLPEEQRTGIGTWIVRAMQEEAAGLGLPVRSTVARMNEGSMRFLEGLGFGVVGGDEVNLEMAWQVAKGDHLPHDI